MQIQHYYSPVLNSSLASGFFWTLWPKMNCTPAPAPSLCLSAASRASAATPCAVISRCFLLPNIISHNNIGQLAAGPVVMIPRSPKGHCGHDYSNVTGGILYRYLAAYFSLVFLSLVCMSYSCSFGFIASGKEGLRLICRQMKLLLLLLIFDPFFVLSNFFPFTLTFINHICV